MVQNILVVSLALATLAHASVKESNQTKSRSFQAVDSAQILSPDEQCRIKFGREASFCRVKSKKVFSKRKFNLIF